MKFAYVDESGDSGYEKSPSQGFAVCAVIIEASRWLELLDEMVQFRRELRDTYGLPVRLELKAQELVQNKGAIKRLGLTTSQRLGIYRSSLDFTKERLDASVFAVVIKKVFIEHRESVDPFDKAWEFLIQRFERRGEPTMVFPDEGQDKFIRAKIRKMRRYSRPPVGGGSRERLERNARNIIEDPVFRDSRGSYFIQLADLCAYAALRHIFPTKKFKAHWWNYLDGCIDARVSRTGPPGIVAWPRNAS
jgi:hypothetical protein